VVFILIDDLSHYGVSAYGSEKMAFAGGFPDEMELKTPRMDQLAEEGLLCENAFAYPLCEPTRIALMSGKYNNRNLLRVKAQHESDIIFSDAFKRAGYTTGIFGKWKQSRGTKEIPAKKYLYQFGWDEFCCFDLVKQGNRFFEPSLVINGEIKNYGEGIDPATGRRWFGPDICNRYALKFIDDHKDDPFFLYYPLSLVHKEDEGNYHVPSPETKPASVFDEFDDDFRDPKGNDRVTRKHFPEMIRYTDTLVGNIVDKLNEHDLRKNTLIVLMGDNGTQRPFIHVLKDGTKYIGRKGTTTDHGMHVPLIFSQPETVPVGTKNALRTYGGLVDLVDLYPTLCEAAGVEVPNAGSIDGLSFWPQVLKGGEPHRKEIYTYYAEPYFPKTRNKGQERVVLEFAFDQRYKRYAPHAGFPRGRFFDVEKDSHEVGGNRKVKAPNFNIMYHSGLDLDRLTTEQLKAFDRLGSVLKKQRYVAVKALKIEQKSDKLGVGEKAKLGVRVLPAQATRNNVIWESSDPTIATVDKFGVLTAHRKGEAKISVYSWEDARPTATNLPVTYYRDGISDSFSLTIH